MDEPAAEFHRQAFINKQPGDGQPALIPDFQPDRYFLAPKGTFFELPFAGDIPGGLARPEQADDVDPQEKVDDRKGEPTLHDGCDDKQNGQ